MAVMRDVVDDVAGAVRRCDWYRYIRRPTLIGFVQWPPPPRPTVASLARYHAGVLGIPGFSRLCHKGLEITVHIFETAQTVNVLVEIPTGTDFLFS